MGKKGSIKAKKEDNMIIKGQEDMIKGTGGMIAEAIIEKTEKGIIIREKPRSIRKLLLLFHPSIRENIKEITHIAHTKASTSQSVERYLRSHLSRSTHRSKTAVNKDL